MLKRYTGIGDCVIGFEADGVITRADYLNTFIPATKEIRMKCEKIRLVYVFGKEWKGMEYTAMIEDMKLGLRHFWSWHRIAIVTDHKALAWFAWFSGLLIPGSVKIFTTKNLEKAFRWVKD